MGATGRRQRQDFQPCFVCFAAPYCWFFGLINFCSLAPTNDIRRKFVSSLYLLTLITKFSAHPETIKYIAELSFRRWLPSDVLDASYGTSSAGATSRPSGPRAHTLLADRIPIGKRKCAERLCYFPNYDALLRIRKCAANFLKLSLLSC